MIRISRNKLVFEHINVDPRRTIRLATDCTNMYISNNLGNHHRILNNRPLPNPSDDWSPPTNESIKINVDAATDLKNSRGAISAVIRDRGGLLLTGNTRRIFCCSSLEAEAQAVLFALQIADSLGVSSVIFNSTFVCVAPRFHFSVIFLRSVGHCFLFVMSTHLSPYPHGLLYAVWPILCIVCWTKNKKQRKISYASCSWS